MRSLSRRFSSRFLVAWRLSAAPVSGPIGTISVSAGAGAVAADSMGGYGAYAQW